MNMQRKTLPAFPLKKKVEVYYVPFSLKGKTMIISGASGDRPDPTVNMALECGANVCFLSGNHERVLQAMEYIDPKYRDHIIGFAQNPQFKLELNRKLAPEIYKEDSTSQDVLKWIYDRAYTRAMMCGPNLHQDDAAAWYKAEYGLTDEQMDDTLIHMAINSRRSASKNPLALARKTYEELAKEQGFDDVMEYMKSFFNPKMTANLRASGLELKCDGAAALIVCPTEMASQFTDKKPIEVLGIGNATREANQAHVELFATQEATRQVYELTGLSGEDLDIFFANDFIITSHLIAAEIAGYLPYGEGWKYICEGRTAWDGDRPINTNGGRTSFGHAHAASGLADVYECCKQMWNECGEREVKKVPKTAMLRGYGGAQNVAAVVIRTLEE